MNAIAQAVVGSSEQHIPLDEFVAEFGVGLLEAVSRSHPPVYAGDPDPLRASVMAGLSRSPFPAQADRVQAIARLLFDVGERAAVLNAEMGTGKTMMAVCLAAIAHGEGLGRTLVISPPHLVYKWRREILETVPGARVWVLNGPDTLAKLIRLRRGLSHGDAEPAGGPEFFVLGRVRMRLGFHWRPAAAIRRHHMRVGARDALSGADAPLRTFHYAACPRCGEFLRDDSGEPLPVSALGDDKRSACRCGERLWTLHRPQSSQRTRRDRVKEAMTAIPTIGPKTADRLMDAFGEDFLGSMLEDNLYQFVNLMDEDGELVFSDRQARRIERALASMEIGFGQGGYQATEYIKRYLPQGYFGLLVVDEGHEYKNEGTAQGQAMAVLSARARKVLLLTGTLMGGYADDLFHLLWRLNPASMIEAGYRATARGMGAASMAFMRDHGVLKDVYTESDGPDHRTARGKRYTVRTSKAPGFGPKGVVQHVLPYTAFLRLKDLGRVLPEYREHTHEVAMDPGQASVYQDLAAALKEELRRALAMGDKSLLGVVLNVLLAWPDCCFRAEAVVHPHRRETLYYAGAVFGDGEIAPKESALIGLCREEKGRGRRVLVYTVYTGVRDTASRLKTLLETAGLKTAVLRASVDTARREDWIMEQVDRGVDVLVANPELVKTGLDLLDFPTIVFMQTGYNVYTVQQAARRSWRIGQGRPVDVHYLGYAQTAQVACLGLMAAKIAVSQSTSGEMPDSGLEVFNQNAEGIEVALARKLLAR